MELRRSDGCGKAVAKVGSGVLDDIRHLVIKVLSCDTRDVGREGILNMRVKARYD